MKTLKHTLRIPTEMYAYLETEFEGSAEEAVELYRHITELVKPKPISEIARNEWIEIYDLVSEGKPIQDDPGILDKLNPLQRFALNEAKNRVKRQKD